MAKIDASPLGADAERAAEQLAKVQDFLKASEDAGDVSQFPWSASAQIAEMCLQRDQEM